MDSSALIATALTLLVVGAATVVRIKNPGWTRAHPIAFVVLIGLGIQTSIAMAVSFDGLFDERDPTLWAAWLRATIAGAAFFWIVRSLGVLTEPPTVVLNFSGPEEGASGTWYEVAGSVTTGRGLITGVSIEMALEESFAGQSIRFQQLRKHDLFPSGESSTGDPPSALSIRYEHAAWHPGHEPGTLGHLYYEKGGPPAVVAWRVHGRGWETTGKIRLAD
jgi:hypothetical protein